MGLMMRPLGMLLLAVAALLVMPTAATAATTFASVAEACGGHDDNERGSGQVDAQGRLYIPCSVSAEYGFDNHIGVFNAAGQKIARIDLEFFRDGRNYRATDVAPSPDGRYLYVMRMGDGLVWRFVRQGDTGYRYRADSQAEWRLADFPWKGCMKRPQGQFLATDGNGDLYVSHGLWWNSGDLPADATACDRLRADTVVKYRPEAGGGRFLSTFGEKGGDTWALGYSRGAWGGVAVTATGDRVFVTDINNSRVQRFDRVPGTDTYAVKLAFGRAPGSSIEANWCYDETDLGLSAPYDVAMSAAGELLAINTSCTTGAWDQNPPKGTLEVYRYAQSGGAPRGVIRIASEGRRRVHGIAVDRAGNVHLVQGERVGMRPASFTDSGADAGGGGPLGGTASVDVTAPTLSVTAPASTIGRTVTVTADAADAVGVTEMRLAVDGAWQPWQPYVRSFDHTLADRLGDHHLAVLVRDGNGNVSLERAVTIRRDAAPVVRPVEPAQPPADGGAQQPAPGGVVAAPNPAPAVGGGVPAVVAGGGAGRADSTRPRIRSVRIPVQVFRGRAASVVVRADDNVRVSRVRFTTGNGRWTKWVPLRPRHGVLLPAGAGWKGVLVQVADAAGNRSTPWFQPVFMAPRGAQWRKGTAGVDRVRTGRGTQHIDSSSFDRVADRISCGGGHDTVLAQPEDVVARDCERVTRLRMPPW